MVPPRHHDGGAEPVEGRVADHLRQGQARGGQHLQALAQPQDGTTVHQRGHTPGPLLAHGERDHRAQRHAHQVRPADAHMVHHGPDAPGDVVEGVVRLGVAAARHPPVSGEVHQQQVVVLAQHGHLPLPRHRAAARTMDQHQPLRIRVVQVHLVVQEVRGRAVVHGLHQRTGSGKVQEGSASSRLAAFGTIIRTHSTPAITMHGTAFST